METRRPDLGGSIGKHACLDGALLRLNFAQEIDWFVEGQIEGRWPTSRYGCFRTKLAHAERGRNGGMMIMPLQYTEMGYAILRLIRKGLRLRKERRRFFGSHKTTPRRELEREAVKNRTAHCGLWDVNAHDLGRPRGCDGRLNLQVRPSSRMPHSYCT